jgi:iron-sulfur cluster assembly accessory protein
MPPSSRGERCRGQRRLPSRSYVRRRPCAHWLGRGWAGSARPTVYFDRNSPTDRPRFPFVSQTPSAVEQLASLSSSSSSPTLLKIGLRTKGCAGMAYHLEYVDKPGRFDEVVEQDGVRVIIDSRALMGVLGSEMDWVEDRLRCVFPAGSSRHQGKESDGLTVDVFSSRPCSAKFVFHNPNIVDACGCGGASLLRLRSGCGFLRRGLTSHPPHPCRELQHRRLRADVASIMHAWPTPCQRTYPLSRTFTTPSPLPFASNSVHMLSLLAHGADGGGVGEQPDQAMRDMAGHGPLAS